MPSQGQRVGEYVLAECIGRGTFGEVWRAQHHAWTDQLAAVKIPTDSKYLANLQREGVAVHGLTHPNIVGAMNFDPYADPPYLVMEYVPGASLRALISQRRLSVADTLGILRQVLLGLAYAHEHGVIHRDVKPENILIHERALAGGFTLPATVKLTDFGLGQAAFSTNSIMLSQESSRNDSVVGTHRYIAPEMLAGGDIDGRADLYACGVILYEMLTGEPPAGTDMPSSQNPAVPQYIDEAFRRSYSRLERRFSSAREFLTFLDHGHKAAAHPQPPLPPPVPVPASLVYRAPGPPFGPPPAPARYPPATPAPPPYAYQPINYYAPAPYAMGRSYESDATTALTWSIVGLLCCQLASIPALIYASKALKGMRASGNATGKGKAIAGLVLGIIELVAVAVFLVGSLASA